MKKLVLAIIVIIILRSYDTEILHAVEELYDAWNF